MLSLFKHQPNSVRRNVVFPRFAYIATRLHDNVKRAVDYYAFRRSVVPAQHPLVRFIDSITIPHSIEERLYFDTVVEAAYSTGRALGFGSSIYAPKAFNAGAFYGTLVNEYVYLVPTDYRKPDVPYAEIDAVTVRNHPRSDFSLLPLRPEFANNESGYAVISIDPGLLLLQYREWRKEQLLLPEEERLTTSHFVSMYVLPNMLYSHIDVVWLNRVINASKGVASAPTRSISGLALPSPDTFSNDVIAKLIEVITQREYHFESLLLGIPTPFSGCFLDTAMLPLQPNTRGTKGFELLTTLPWIEFMFALDGLNDSQQNRKTENELRLALRRAVNERWLSFVENADVRDLEERLELLRVRYLT